MMIELQISQRVSPDEAVRIARKLYGLQGSARSMPGEYDHNFQITTVDGGSFVLKVMHPGRERPLVDLQCQALQHLASHAPGLALPRVHLTLQGEPFTKVPLSDGEERFVWLLNFV